MHFAGLGWKCIKLKISLLLSFYKTLAIRGSVGKVLLVWKSLNFLGAGGGQQCGNIDAFLQTSEPLRSKILCITYAVCRFSTKLLFASRISAEASRFEVMLYYQNVISVIQELFFHGLYNISVFASEF